MNEQPFVTIAAGPMLSLIIVLAGYIVQNVNHPMQAEFRVIRAAMEKNQSELLAKFADLGNRLAGLEQIVRK
jgi:hypothetical protein